MYAIAPKECQPALSNALKHILINLESKHIKNVIRAFEDEFAVKIEEDGYNWKTLEFESYAHFLEWFIRWS